MEKRFILRSLLWLRWLVLGLLSVLVLLGLVLYFAANSPRVIKKAADIYAKDYNVSYDDITGSALKGIKVDNLRFKGRSLAKKLQLKWNPNDLVRKKISIKTLQLQEANVDVIQSLIDSFAGEENATADQGDEGTANFDVTAKNVDITLAPFVMQNIDVSQAGVKVDALAYSEDSLFVDSAVLDVETNLTHISLVGSMKKQHLKLEKLNLDDVNVSALLSMFTQDDNATNQSTGNQTQKQQSKNPFLPKMVSIDKLTTNLLPFTYEPVKMKQVVLNASSLKYDVQNNMVEEVQLDLNGTTNLSNLSYKGYIEHNHLIGKIHLKPNNRLYELYGLPLRKEAIANIIVDFNASTEGLVADVKAKGTNILKSKKGEFNIDVDAFVSHVSYDFNTTHLLADSEATVTTPYAKDIVVTNHFVMDKNISYSGDAKVAKLSGFDKKLVKPLEHIELVYKGNDKKLDAALKSDALKASFETKDFKTAQVHLESIKTLRLNEIITLPEELKDTEVNIVADAPLDFAHYDKIDAKVKLSSNVINMDAVVAYGKEIGLKGTMSLPKDSLLKAYSEDVKWKALSPLDASVQLGKERVDVTLNSKVLNAAVKYGPKEGSLNGKINLAGVTANVSGKTKGTLKVQTKITSLSALRKDISQFYTLEALPPIEGNIDVALSIEKLKSADLTLSSSKLIYKADKKTKHIIKDVKVVASMDSSSVILKSYKGTFKAQKYFSTRPARITIGDTIEVSNLWINDELKVDGDYRLKTKQGKFVADAKKFRIKDKIADLETNIHLTAQLDGNNTTIEGKVILLKGKVTPEDIASRTFPSDSDIIILQDMKNNKKNPFMENLTLLLRVESKEALHLKQGPMNIQLKPDFTITKEKGGPLLYLGSIELLKGGTYIFQKKRFVLAKSYLYFTGDVNKPILDIKAKHKTLDYLVTIAVTGIPAAPNINFSSSPSLSREQILSLILFDSVAGGDTNSGEDMMKMMGGAMAKSALSDAGVKVDHLAFGEGNSIEVGKKLTNKVTVIYINGDIPSVRLKYQHTPRTESVIEVNEESQSYDIIYKRDF